MFRQIFIILFLIIYSMFFNYACSYYCNCHRYLGCKTISARKISNDSILRVAVFCPETDLYSDQMLEDSVKAFYDLYYNYGIVEIVEIDSIKSQDYAKTKGGKSKPYQEAGYKCSCPK